VYREKNWRDKVHPSKSGLADLFEYICRRNSWMKSNGAPSMRQLSIKSGYSEAMIHSMLNRDGPPRARTLEDVARAARLPDVTAQDLRVAAGDITGPELVRPVERKIERAQRYNAGDHYVTLDDTPGVPLEVGEALERLRTGLRDVAERASTLDEDELQQVVAIIDALNGEHERKKAARARDRQTRTA
jgi:hypothetical protein